MISSLLLLLLLLLFILTIMTGKRNFKIGLISLMGKNAEN